jgi:PAS domain-containing protein
MSSGKLPANDSLLRSLLDAIPSMVFAVDENVVVLEANRAAHRALGGNPEFALKRLCGEVLHCLHSGCGEVAVEASRCGTTEFCDTCVLRQSSKAAREGHRVERQPCTMVMAKDGAERMIHLEVSATAFDHAGSRLTLLILEDVTALKELLQLIPVCAWCRKVRDDGQFKDSLETWLVRHTELRFSHGMCPDCENRLSAG